MGMNSTLDSLQSIDWRTLDLVGSASTPQMQETRIELRQVVGWPFAWLLHPGIANGLAVADTRALLNLQQAGLLVITSAGSNDGVQFLTLTRYGVSVVLERAQVKQLTDFTLDVPDYGDGAGWH